MNQSSPLSTLLAPNVPQLTAHSFRNGSEFMKYIYFTGREKKNMFSERKKKTAFV